MPIQIVMDRSGRHPIPVRSCGCWIGGKALRELTQRGFTAVALGKDGAANRVVKTFDPNIERTLFIPQLEGGWVVQIAWSFIWANTSRPSFAHVGDASKVASQLLRDVLSPVQRAQYDSLGFFDVMGAQTGNWYRILTGSQMNIQELNANGDPVSSLCVVARGALPVGDVHLAQKLALELIWLPRP